MPQERNFDYLKKETKKKIFDLFGCLVFFAVLIAIIVSVALFAMEDEKQKLACLCAVVPFLALICVGFFIGLIYMLRLYFIIRKADITQTEEIEINCKKVKFISYPVSRFSWRITGTVLCADCGRKYICFFSNDYYDSDKKELKSKLTRKMTLQKYGNSQVVYGVEKYL